MSLHYYVVPPPLALAVHPAPPRKQIKKDDKKDKDGEMGKKDDKEKKDDKNEKDDKNKKDDKKEDKAADRAKQGDDAADKGKEDRRAEGDKKTEPLPATPADAALSPALGTPESPGSMVPEPPTPASGALRTPTPEPKKGDDVPQVPAPNPATPKGESKPTQEANSKDTPEEEGEKEPEPVPEPLRLLGPAPHRPLKTRLDLDQSRPYPPINVDPRGAYHEYAKAVRGELIYVDVTKDGWLAQQWREKPEREALAKLKGETEKQKEREMQADRKSREKRKVPKTSEGVLLDLWNDCADARSQEVHVDYFWSRYDWADPDAQCNLLDVKKGEDGSIPQLDGGDLEWTREGLEEILATVGVQFIYNVEKPIPRNGWEASGAYLVMGHGFFMIRLEDALQWKPEESANKFELLVTSHHDRVFGEMVKAQQAEERKKKEIAYRERKMAERKKREEEEKANGGKGKEGEKGEEEKEGKGEDKLDEKGDKKDMKGNKKETKADEKVEKGAAEPGKEEARTGKNDEEAKKDQKAEKVNKGDEDAKEAATKAAKLGLSLTPDDTLVATPAPGTPASNVKVKDGEELKPTPSPLVGVSDGEGHAIIAVPIQSEVKERAEEKKHEVEVIAAAPNDVAGRKEAGEKDKEVEKDKEEEEEKKATPAKEAAKNEKPREKIDPMRDAELLAKMIQASGGGPDGPVGMDDIKLAFKALERAAEAGMAGPGGGGDGKGRDKGPVIWTWGDSCERWRWRNFEAGVHEVRPGGWEERDWKVFADDRGCADFDEEMETLEEDEEDVHDWTC